MSKSHFLGKRGDAGGYWYIIAMIIGLCMIIFLIWLAMKSGNLSLEQIEAIK